MVKPNENIEEYLREREQRRRERTRKPRPFRNGLIFGFGLQGFFLYMPPGPRLEESWGYSLFYLGLALLLGGLAQLADHLNGRRDGQDP